MARNLSKISAVISVNTQEARQQLAGFAGDAKKYAKSLDSSFQSMTRGVQRSLDKIWTEQQRVQRAIQAGAQAGVDPKVLRMFGDTKKLEQEANKIAELRKRAFDMKTFEGNAAATAEIDKIAAAFTRLNDKLVRTGSISKKELAALQMGIAGIATGVGVIGKQDDRLGTSRTIRDQFSSGKLSEFFESKQLSQSVRQLEAYRNILLQVGATAKGPIQTAFSNLVKVQAKAAKEGVNGQQKYRREIEAARVALEKLIAAEAKVQGGRSRNLRTANGIRNMVDRSATGSINSDWGTRTGLAIQQLTFAFDDFNSATGGVDAKIRAMGNNISQFGLIAGGTAGLIGGVLVGALAQLYASYLKQADALNDSKNVTKVVAEEEKKLVEARKKQLDIIKEIGDSIRNAGLTEQQRSELAANKESEDFKAAAEQRARGRVGIADPELRRLRSRNAQIEEALANPDTSLARRRQLQAEQRGLSPRIRAREEELLRADDVSPLQLLSDFQEEMARVVRSGVPLPSNFFEQERRMNQITALQGTIPQEMYEEMVRQFLEDWAAQANPNGLATRDMFDIASQAATLGQNREAREEWMQAQGVGELIPAFRDAESELNSVSNTIGEAFGDAIPDQYLATMEDIREDMDFVWQQLADGAITAEQAAAEMERLNGTLENVSAEAKKAGEELEREREAERKWNQDRKDAVAQLERNKENFRQNDPMFAEENALEKMRNYYQGAIANGLNDSQAQESVRDMMVREFAPAIMQMAAARETSLLKGASKKAMDLTDISTTAGTAELNRLLSGEDSAQNADLAELRKQTELLGTLVEQAEDEGVI